MDTVPSHRLILAAGVFREAEVEQRHLGARGVHVELASLNTPELIAAATAGADGVIVATNPLDSHAIDALGPFVRVIGRVGIGLDAIDLQAARQRGIGVVYTPDYCTHEVATHALAMILASIRRLNAGDRIARADWKAWRSIGELRAITDVSVGIVGCGRIGSRVAELLSQLGASVVAYDPEISSADGRITVAPSLEELLRVSDVVTLHAPLTPDTRALIGAEQLAVMKPGAVLVNVARGALVDEDALAEALETNALAGACLDVLCEEPPDPGSRLLRAPNLILTPHVAWYSPTSELRARTDAVDAMLAYLDGSSFPDQMLAVDARAV